MTDDAAIARTLATMSGETVSHSTTYEDMILISRRIINKLKEIGLNKIFLIIPDGESDNMRYVLFNDHNFGEHVVIEYPSIIFVTCACDHEEMKMTCNFNNFGRYGVTFKKAIEAHVNLVFRNNLKDLLKDQTRFVELSITFFK